MKKTLVMRAADVANPLGLEALLDVLPHGICQFDQHHRLILANRRFQQLYGLPDVIVQPGVSRDELLGWIDCTELRSLLQRSAEQQRGFNDFVEIYHDLTGRVIAISCEGLPNGGYAFLHEDLTEISEKSRTPAPGVDVPDPFASLLDQPQLQQELRYIVDGAAGDTTVALLTLHLDGFQEISRTFGSVAADALLFAVAARLRQHLRAGDLVARVGTAEFAIVQQGASQPDGARSLGRRLVELLSVPFEVVEQVLTVGATVGVAVCSEVTQTAEELWKHSGQALQRARAEGRGGVRFYEMVMEEHPPARRSLEAALRQGLLRGEFQLAYQPIFDLRRRCPLGAESLLRWQHPRLGTILPKEFLTTVEESGLMIPLGAWILRQACQEAVAWPVRNFVTVNISPVQLRHRSFVASVVQTLQETGLSPQQLELEMTENTLLGDSEQGLDRLQELRGHGVRIVLDDFGSGCASINTLQRVSFDKVKLGRSLFAGIDSPAFPVVRMVTELSAACGAATAAVGVETSSELASLVAVGCDQGQGFYFGAPVSAADLQRLFQGPQTLN